MTRTTRHIFRVLPLSFACLAFSANAQVTNGGFESGALAPWTVTNTAHGLAIFSFVGQVDLDGPGPRPSSFGFGTMAGQGGGSSPGVSEGIIVHQTVTLQAGIVYEASFEWGAHATVPVLDASAGIFDLLIDGVSIAQASAPPLASNGVAWGSAGASFTPTVSGPHDVGVRIARAISAGYEQNQYVDNIVVRERCRADVNLDGSVTPADVAFFINTWYSSLQGGTLGGDFDGSGAVDPADVAAYITAWLGALTNGC